LEETMCYVFPPDIQYTRVDRNGVKMARICVEPQR